MVDVDPDTLLEWLSSGHGEERDMQLIALEQLCMLLLMSDNVDRCFESCPPRVFLPALCRVFLDESAPENVLEVTARAITYYLDVSAECTRRIVSVDGAVKMLCNRLVAVDLESRTSKDLAEQCVKVLELMCTRETSAIFDAGGLHCILTFIKEFGNHVHKDTLHSSMSVVSRLCSRMEPQDTQLETCVHSLSMLLKYEDAFVSDSALKCFASVADRFTRQGMDPAPLAKHGLIEDLLGRLAKAGASGSERPNKTSGTPDSKNVSPPVTTVVSLLSTLCRGSPVITNLLLHSKLPEAIDKALQGDERCILDTLRLVNLLLVLLFEGRKALPKSGLLSTPAGIPGFKKLEPNADKSHRQLIDCIRSKDTAAFVEAVEEGGFEVNFMDDVGQTLLNWASAFGTLEMVEYLCEKGADVNRGHRSSSLHYAACFGRPLIAKMLLRHGADPELHDEDGKTPADKARERHDEGHREVLEILQSPSDWMTPFNNSANAAGGGKGTSDGKVKNAGKSDEDDDCGDTADPETASSYIVHLLPLFMKAYQTSMVISVKKAILSLSRKMVFYSTGENLQQLAKLPGFASGLVEMTAAVFENEDDDDGHLAALKIIQDLLEKANDLFIEHFARLGVISKVSEIVGPLLEEEGEDERESGVETGVTPAASQEDKTVQEDATEIIQGEPYHWRDWCIIRSRDCLYLWNDSCALELSNGSNGWFRFILNNKLATMYSSGSPEGGSDSSESRGEFLEKLQRARNQVKSDVTSQPILSNPNPVNLLVGNWSFACQKKNELHIYNSDGQQTTILCEDLPGFVFESNRGTRHMFTAETSLGEEFASGWAGKRGKKFVSKAEVLKMKVKATAKEIQEKYFEAALSSPREVVIKLQDIVRNIYSCCDVHEKNLDMNGDSSWEKDMIKVLQSFLELLKEDNTVSSYELQTSGIVRALLHCLSQRTRNTDDEKTKQIMAEKAHQRIELFKKAFGESVKSFAEHLDSFEAVSPAVSLIRKLIAVLEMSERLPVYSFENMANGLQILTRRLRIRLERSSGENSLIDRTGRNLKIEPLTTIEALKNYLGTMVAKQWFDFDRNTFTFIKKINNSTNVFTHSSDFDDNGILYWIGTNARTTSDWVNPASVGLVVVTSSEGRALPYGKLEDIVSRDGAALNCHTNDDKNAWFVIDLGVFVIPSSYTLRHARGYGRSALRNWFLEVSKDNKTWTIVKTHTNDASLSEPGSTATWKLDVVPEDSEGWRYIRIHQNGKNASNQTHYLSLSGFELYGTIVSAVEESLGRPVREHESVVKRQRRMKTLLKHFTGKAGRGFGGVLKEGDLLEPSVEAALAKELSGDWVEVAWAEGLPAALRSAAMSMRAGMKELVGEASSSYSHAVKHRLKGSGRGREGTSSSGVSIKVESCGVSAGTLSSNAKNLEKVSAAAVEQRKNEEVQCKTPDDENGTTGETSVVSSKQLERTCEESEDKNEQKDVKSASPNGLNTDQSISTPSGTFEDNLGATMATRVSSSSQTTNTAEDDRKQTAAVDEPVGLLGIVKDGENLVNQSENATEEETPATKGEEVQIEVKGITLDEDVSSVTSQESRTSGMIYRVTPSASGKVMSVGSTASTASSNPTSDSEVENIPMDCTLLADLEDEPDDIPDQDEEEEEDDDDDEDNEENEDEFGEMEENELHNLSMRSRRSWDDDFCLKRQFTALIPAFDPRPGRSNVQQIQDVEVPLESEQDSPSTSRDSEIYSTPEIELVLKSPSTPGAQEVSIPLEDPKATIFSYIHKLALLSGKMKAERLRRIWEPTYTLIYKSLGNSRKSAGEQGKTKPSNLEEVESQLETDVLEGTSPTPGGEEVKSPTPGGEEVTSLTPGGKEVTSLTPGGEEGTSPTPGGEEGTSSTPGGEEGTSPTPGGEEGTSKTDRSSLLKRTNSIQRAVFINDNHLDSIEDILKLIRLLYSISTTSMEEFGEDVDENYGFIISSGEFNSKKITLKLAQQIKDPLISSSGSLPRWCERVMSSYPMLFPFDTRQMYFNSTAFGCARTIIWLQTSRDAAVERSRTPSSRRDDQHEFSIGRLKHERIRISRDEKLLESAIRVLSFHCERKSILEFEFEGEEGTGLGPTLEFYSLVAAALQEKSLGIFLCDDDIHNHNQQQVDIGHGLRAPGFYIQRPGGLFPAPLPQESDDIERVCKLFTFLGIFMAKSLQDNRLVDIPLSRSFLKLLCNGGGDNSMVPTLPTTHGHPSKISLAAEGLDDTCSYEDERQSLRDLTTNELDGYKKVEDENDINKLNKLSKVCLIEEDLQKEQSEETENETDCEPARNVIWFSGLLDENDLLLTNPHHGSFIRQLRELARKKSEILNDSSLTKEEKKESLHSLKFTTTTGVTCYIEDLGLTFQYLPTSRVYKHRAMELKPGGEDESLSLANVEEYVQLMTDFCLYSGIKKQMDAFKDGFNKVFPMEKLQPFSPSELQLMISGEQMPQWTREDLLNFTEPKYGFTRESPVYQRFVNVLTNMTGEERKAFLQFTTGCSSLPPGGLANLHPHLTVVRKDKEGDGSYPSVNTCVHYLKLPEYSSEEILRDKLLAATKEKGFHLN